MEIGAYRHTVTLENPGPPVPDGSGGFTEAWVALVPPTVSAAIIPATARDMERVTAGTVTTSATHLIRLRFHPGVTTETRITRGQRAVDGTLRPGSREFQIAGLVNTEERNIELVALCTEVLS